MKNLWPESFREQEFEVPRSIFEQQATLLPKLTGDMVYAKVTELSPVDIFRDGIENNFAYGFYLIGKFLEKYSYKVLSFSHDVTLYPVLININSEIREELGIKNIRVKVESPEKLESLLENILKTNRVSKIIGSIIKISTTP